MLRKITVPIILLCFMLCLLPAFSSAIEVEEMDLDITQLITIEDEEIAREKKDSDGALIMTITCAGDFTIGGDNFHHKDLFTPALVKHGNNINFVMQDVRSLFMNDDLTLINFEGTLTDRTEVPKSIQDHSFLFNITPSAVSVLKDNGVEAVSLENNHVMDHGEEGYEDTKNALQEAGIIYSNSDEMGIYEYELGGIKIAMLSYLCIDRYGKPFKGFNTFEEKVAADIQSAKEYYPLVIVSFHWGKELMYTPTENQIRLGRMAVDSGADLVIGHHSHRIQPIECYNGKYICYSLGNFCFAGNKKPSDMSAILFQIRYRVKNGVVSYRDFRIVPIRISSTKEKNDFIPTILEDGYERDSILMTLTSKENIRNLPYAVTDLPLTWQ